MGTFSGRYCLRPISYRTYEYTPDEAAPFAFTTSLGWRIQPERMETDGATIPRLFWSLPGFDPMDWIDGAVIHDWLYECNHRGLSSVTFSQANAVLAECLQTLGVAHIKRRAIMGAVGAFGRIYWNKSKTEGA